MIPLNLFLNSLIKMNLAVHSQVMSIFLFYLWVTKVSLNINQRWKSDINYKELNSDTDHFLADLMFKNLVSKNVLFKLKFDGGNQP